MTGIEDIGALAGILNGLYSKYKNRTEALEIIEDLAKIAREGYIEISSNSFRDLGLLSLATEENVQKFVMQGLRAAKEPAIAILYQTYDDKLSPIYRVHMIPGEEGPDGAPVAMNKRLDDIEIRREYFRSHDVTVVRVWDPEKTPFPELDNEAMFLTTAFRKAGLNFKYIAGEIIGNDHEILSECRVLSVEEKITRFAEEKEDRSR